MPPGGTWGQRRTRLLTVRVCQLRSPPWPARLPACGRRVAPQTWMLPSAAPPQPGRRRIRDLRFLSHATGFSLGSLLEPEPARAPARRRRARGVRSGREQQRRGGKVEGGSGSGGQRRRGRATPCPVPLSHGTGHFLEEEPGVRARRVAQGQTQARVCETLCLHASCRHGRRRGGSRVWKLTPNLDLVHGRTLVLLQGLCPLQPVVPEHRAVPQLQQTRGGDPKHLFLSPECASAKAGVGTLSPADTSCRTSVGQRLLL